MEMVYLLEYGYAVQEAFTSVEAAYDRAIKLCSEWNLDDEDFNSLKSTYEDKRYSGFCIDDILYCYAVELVK